MHCHKIHLIMLIAQRPLSKDPIARAHRHLVPVSTRRSHTKAQRNLWNAILVAVVTRMVLHHHVREHLH